MFNMILLSEKKRVAGIIILAIAAFFAISVIRPAVKYVQQQIFLYRPALNEYFPTLQILPEGGLGFIGDIPTTVILQDSVQIFVDYTVNDSLIKNSKKKSIFISSDEFCYKRENDVWKTSLMGIEADNDSTLIDAITLKKKIDDYSATALLISFSIVTLFFFVALWLLALFGGGIGIMVDAFNIGVLNYIQAVNFASFGLLFWVILSYIVHPKEVNIYFLFLSCYLICTAIGVYLLNVFTKQTE